MFDVLFVREAVSPAAINIVNKEFVDLWYILIDFICRYIKTNSVADVMFLYQNDKS